MNEVNAALVALILGLPATYIALRKWPLDSRKVKVETIDLNVNIADRLRDGAVADWERMRGELDDLTREFAEYKRDTESRLAEMAVELRAERAEKVAVKQENDQLRARVVALEAEVRALKANGQS